MTIRAFAADADLVGHRVRVTWEFEPRDPETLADVPPVTLRRKLRDYAFPPAAGADRFIVYDSSAFPPTPVPGVRSVTDLPSWETKDGDERTVFEPVSVAAIAGGRMIEVLRRTIATTYDSDGTPLRQRFEILDAGSHPGDLRANTVYYYQLFGAGLPTSGDDASPFRTAAQVTNGYGLNRTLWNSVPEIYRRHDVTSRPMTPGTDTVPELAPRSGELRRFVDLFGIALDSLRGTAEGLPLLHDLDRVDAKYLSSIAQWIGWDLDVGAEIPLRRNEIKTAPRLYRLVGTLPGLRALVTQLTGWSSQVAELAQNIALSNEPPHRNLFAVTLDADGLAWHGVDEAADALGFRTGNQHNAGAAGVAATLTGSVAEPFALRAGMELTVKVDAFLPATVRFGLGDFADPAKATAAEVANAIARALPSVAAAAAGGRVTLASTTVGDRSELEVIPAPTSLLSLEGAPGGRLSAFTEAPDRIRLFYEAWERPTEPDPGVPAGASVSSAAGTYLLRRIRYKTWVNGAWRGSRLVFPVTSTPQADPAAVALPDGRLWVAWIDQPQTASSAVRFAVGASRPAVFARVAGQRREPFTLKDGSALTVTGSWSGADQFIVHAADFANVARASAAETVAAMNAQLTHAVAVRESDGSIALLSKAVGPTAEIQIDLRQSTAARVFGFDQRNTVGAPGSWSDEIDWTDAFSAPSIAAGYNADPAAVADPAAGVRLAWAMHAAGLWRVATGHWRDRILLGTSAGVLARVGSGAWAPVAGLPSNDVRDVALDSDGTAWIATANGVALLHSDGTLSALAAALPSNDVRRIVLASDGTAWMGTAAGVAARAVDGTLAVMTTVQGLPSNDVRSIAVGPDGSAWIVTAGGLAARFTDGTIVTVLASPSIFDVAVAGDGTVYVATSAGLMFGAPGAFSLVDSTNGLASSDVRAVRIGPDGTVWVATAAGVSARSNGGAWIVADQSRGLPTNDVRMIAPDGNGGAWAGTAAGVAVIARDGSASAVDVAGGGAAPAVRAIQAGWSATRELASAAGGNREPSIATDENGRTWLVWSQRLGSGTPDESWALRYRIFDPATRAWGAEQPLTAPPALSRASDRSPSAMRVPGGMRVYFSSDRNGGFGLWSVDVTLGGLVGPLVLVLDEPSSDIAPAPVGVGSAVWLLYRSDRNVALATVGASLLEEGLLRSVRVPDNGTIRRYAGHVTLVPGDLVRTRTRRTFGDMLSYTPNRPDGSGQLADDELYTRGTIALYVSPSTSGSVVTEDETNRLRELLARFIPANLRALVMLRASSYTDYVYTAGNDILERYTDSYPFAEAFGAIADTTAAAMPGVVVIKSNLADNVSANPADLTTLKRRSFFPPIH